MLILPSSRKLNAEYLSFADDAAIKAEQDSIARSSDTRVSRTAGSSREIGSLHQPELLKSLGVSDYNKCT